MQRIILKKYIYSLVEEIRRKHMRMTKKEKLLREVHPRKVCERSLQLYLMSNDAKVWEKWPIPTAHQPSLFPQEGGNRAANSKRYRGINGSKSLSQMGGKKQSNRLMRGQKQYWPKKASLLRRVGMGIFATQKGDQIGRKHLNG